MRLKLLVAVLMCFLVASTSGIGGKHACIGSVCDLKAGNTNTNTNTNKININIGAPVLPSTTPHQTPTSSMDMIVHQGPLIYETKIIAANHVVDAARDAATRSGIFSMVYIPDQYGEVALSHENSLLLAIEAAPQQGFVSVMAGKWMPTYASPDNRYLIAIAYGEIMPANTIETRAGIKQNDIVVYCFDIVTGHQSICRYWLDLSSNTVKFYTSS